MEPCRSAARILCCYVKIVRRRCRSLLLRGLFTPGEFQMKNHTLAAVSAATLSLCLLAGCHVSSNKNGQNNNVDVQSPFGSMHIKTNDNVDTTAIGITAYPGATPWKNDAGENKNNDNGSADINMSFGDFHLGVKAASFRTTDSQDKILAFYKKDLARYGEVIECKGNTTIGQPAHTGQGLTCADKDTNHMSTDGGEQVELRAGSQAHQHIVAVEPKDGALKLGLVALDLPTHLGTHDSKDSE